VTPGAFTEIGPRSDPAAVVAETSVDTAAAIESVAGALEHLDPAAQQAAVAAIPRPGQATANRLWVYLMLDLLLLDVIALGGVGFLLADSDDVRLLTLR
jgi:hypothetical protein